VVRDLIVKDDGNGRVTGTIVNVCTYITRLGRMFCGC